MRKMKIEKIGRRMTALLCCVTTMICMVGCGAGNSAADGSTAQEDESGNAGAGAAGRYVETALDHVQTNTDSGLFKLDDGSIWIDNSKRARLEKSVDDGATWTEELSEELYSAVPTGMDSNGVCMFGDGSIFCSYIDWNQAVVDEDDEDDMEIISNYIYVKADGTTSQGELSFDSKDEYLQKIIASADGRVFGLNMTGEVYEIDPETGKATDLFSLGGECYSNIYICGSYLAGVGDQMPYLYDLEKNQLLDTDTVLSDFLADNLKLDSDNLYLYLAAGDAEDTIYLACSKGFYRHVIGGNVMEQMMDGSLNSLGDTAKTVTGITTKSDGNILILYSDGSLCSYDYNADVATVPGTQLKIYSLYENSTVRQAVSEFRKADSDVYLNYEVGMSGSDSMTEEDAIKNLNTELMAGSGPDILLLDGLPMESYAQKGLLLDLSDTVNSIKSQESYFENILTAYQTQEGIYGIPCRFALPVLAGKSDRVKDVKTFADLAKRMTEQGLTGCAYLNTFTEEELLELLYQTASPELLQEDGSMNEERLTQFLTDAKTVYEAEQAGISEDMMKSYQESYASYTQGDQDKMQEVSADKLNIGFQAIGITGTKQGVLAGYLQGRYSDTAEMTSALQAVGDGTFTSFPGLNESGSVFVASGVVGINSKSQQMDLTKEFLSVILSKDVQKVVQSDGYPVNSEAFDLYFEGEQGLDSSVGTSSEDGEELYLDIRTSSEADMAQLKSMIGAVTTPSLMDTTIKDTIVENGVEALNGEKSVDTVVAAIMQKIGLYTEE